MSKIINKEEILIDDKWITTAESYETYNKYTGEVYNNISIASEELVDQAITVAEKAFRETTFSPQDRYDVLMKTASLIEANKDRFATIIAKEGGKPIADARVEVSRSINTLVIAAEEAKKIVGEIIPNFNAQDRFLYTVRKPVGIVAAITPFNFPLNLVVHKVAPALAAGNPVILKPASETPTVAIELCKLIHKAGVPKNFIQCVIGGGRTVGERLLQDERIAHYTFTGSPAVGKHIQQTIGLRDATLELGSNSATIVHHDADIDKAVAKLAKMSFAHAGQICISVQRILVHESIQEEFMEKFLQAIKVLKIGNPLDENTDVGPMINESEAERVERWIEEAKADGAKVLTGGTRERNLFQPTVLTDVKQGMKVLDEELFAPVVSVTSYETIEEAIRFVNDSKYGLQAGIYTSDINLTYRIPHLLEVGGVVINDTCCYRTDQMPYGGVKESGNGKEGPAYAIEAMTEAVTVVVNLED